MITPLIICYIFICLLNMFYYKSKWIWMTVITFLLIPVEYNDVVSYLINEYLLQIISLILFGYKEYVRASIFCFATIMSCVYLYVTLFVSDYTLIVYWIHDYVYYEFLLVLALSLKEGKNILYYALVIMLLLIGHTI